MVCLRINIDVKLSTGWAYYPHKDFFIIFIISLQVPISFITIHGLLVFFQDICSNTELILFGNAWLIILWVPLCSCSNLSMGISHGWTTSVLLWIKRVMLEETGMKPGSPWHGPPSAQVVTCYDPAAYSCQQPARKQPTPIHFSGLCFCSPHNAGAQEEWGWFPINTSMWGKNKTPLT